MKNIIENISAEDLDTYIDRLEENVIIVDVRKKNKYLQRHIQDSINVPYEDIVADRHNLPINKPIILYCDRGGMSILAAKYLLAKGYMVKNVVGGIRNYRGKNIV